MWILATTAFATDRTVGPGGDYPTIAAAVAAAAAAGDRVVVGPGTWAETVDPLGKALTIVGRDGPEVTSVRAARFTTAEEADTVLEGFTLENPDDRALYVDGASPTLRDLVVQDTGDPTRDGGAARVDGAAAPVFERVTFRDVVGARGGAVWLGADTIASFTDCAFEGSGVDGADQGGAIYLDGGALTVTGGTFTGTRAAAAGGAVAAIGGAVTFVDSVVSGAAVSAGSGGGLWADGAIVSIEGGAWSANAALDDAVGGGGAIAIAGGALSIVGATFSDNRHRLGADVHAVDTIVDADAATFRGGLAEQGGAVWMTGGALTTGTCVFEGALAAGDGAAIFASGVTSWTDAGSALAGNTITTGDGTIWVEDFGSLGFTDTTFEANAVGEGAAVSAIRGDSVRLTNVSVTGNGAFAAGYSLSFVDVATTTLDGLSATDNVGAGLRSTGGGTLTVSDSVFRDNGGAAIDAQIAETTLTGVSLEDHATTADLVHLSGAVATLVDVTLTGNELAAAAAIRVDAPIELTLTRLVATETVSLRGVLNVDDPGAVVTVLDATFQGNRGVAGAAVQFSGDRLTVRNSTFEANSNLADGGAVAVTGATWLEVEDSTFGHHTAQDGGAIHLAGTVAVVLEGDTFSGGFAIRGGAVAIEGAPDSVDVRSCTFTDNEADLGGALWTEATTLRSVNNTWAANIGLVCGGHLHVPSLDPFVSTNDVFAYARGHAVCLSDTEGALVPHFALLHDNLPDFAPEPYLEDGTTRALSPAFTDWTNDGVSNDDLTPGEGSVLIDHGDPEVWDVDGTRSDIGATGGPWAGPDDQDSDGIAAWDGDCHDLDPSIHPGVDDPVDGADADCDGLDETDLDGDGATAAAFGGDDCDDADPSIHPNAAEACDTIDRDCDGDPTADAIDAETLYADADGDGFADPDGVLACAGTPGLVPATDSWDCDDEDDTRYPGAPEAAGDGVDQDCDGEDPAAETGDPKGCAAASRPTASWGVAAALLAVRRARSGRVTRGS